MGSAPNLSPAIDGRTARAERTRDAVVDALLDLIRDGDLRPTAARVARRAGVSLRSVFQHFDDMEALLACASARQVEEIAEIVTPIPPDQPLEQRVRALVDQRARVFEAIAPVRRSSLLQEPFSPALREARDRVLHLACREIEQVFAAELESLDAGSRRDVVTAIDATLTWETWEHLRTRRRLSVAQARRVATRAVSSLLGCR